MKEIDLALSDGRTLHAYDTGPDDESGRLAAFWHHGTLRPDDGHVSVLGAAESAMNWLTKQTG